MNSTKYKHWWDKLWTEKTINTGGIKYKQSKLSILEAKNMNINNYQYWWVKIWTVLTINTGGEKYELLNIITGVIK